jgi:hypothetical protein
MAGIKNTPYHEPGIMPDRDIAQGQTETIGLTFSEAIAVPKIVAVFNNAAIKQWTEGQGITVAPDRLSASYDLAGQDLVKGLGGIVKLEFTFWRAGVVEYTQNISVARSYV